MAGVDLSCYAIANAAPNVRPFVGQGDFLDGAIGADHVVWSFGKTLWRTSPRLA